MNVLVLNGAPRDGRGGPCRRVTEAAASGARARGSAVTVFDLDAMAIKPCRGCFACWLKHPGTCAIKDDEESVLAAAAASDIQIWTTPVAFGGYGQALKKALDRSIPNYLPFFIRVRGEAHHPQRYAGKQKLLVLGTLPSPDAEAERVFHDLVLRNALNLGSAATLSRVFFEGTPEEDIGGELRAMFDTIAGDR